MEFRCTPADASSWASSGDGDTLAVGLFSGDDGTTLEALEARFGPGLKERLEQRRFKAKLGDVVSFDWLGGRPSTLLLVGLGEAETFDLGGLRRAAATAAKAALAAGAKDLGLALPLAGPEPAAAASAIAGAVRLSLFVDQRFKSEAEPSPCPSVSLLGFDAQHDGALAAVGATCAGVELARELVAAPPTWSHPRPWRTPPPPSRGTSTWSSRCWSAPTARPWAWALTWR